MVRAPVLMARLEPSRTLCGFSPSEFGGLVEALAPLEQARIDAIASRPDRVRSPGAGRRPEPFANRLLAVLVLLRTGVSNRQMAKLAGVHEWTIRDWRNQILDMLVSHGVVMPGADRPVRSPEELAVYLKARAMSDPLDYVIIDGTHTRAARPGGSWEEQREGYYWKAHTHAARGTVVTDPDGTPLWFEAEPAGRGKTNDFPMLRTQALLGVLAYAGITVLADRGYRGLDKELNQDVWIPSSRRKGTKRTRDDSICDRAIATARIHVEHGIGRLKRWDVLNRYRRHRSTYGQTGQSLIVLESIRTSS